MKVSNLCILTGMMVVGYGAWALADQLSLGVMGSFVASGIGSILGVWAGWKAGRKLD